MAVDNRVKLWELVTNTVKNLFMQDQSMTMFDHESDGNFVRVIGTPGTDPGGIGNGWATTYSIAEALGTIDSRPSGTNPVFQLRAISGTWTSTIGSSTLSGTGGAASTELFAGRNIIINGKVNKVQGTTGANTISLYKAADFAGTYTVYEVVTVAERLNGIQNSNQPNLSFLSAVLSYVGATSVRGLPTSITAGNLTVSGAAGWRYIVCSTSGVITIETIPGGEITANTFQYTPAPVFNSIYQGYYSSVNPNLRIIGICYFDGSVIKRVIAYKNGRNKNDNVWQSTGSGILAGGTNDRLQYTASFGQAWGDGITCVDNGAGSTDAFGFRVTANRRGKITFDFTVLMQLVPTPSALCTIAINKNGLLFKDYIQNLNAGSGVSSLQGTNQVSVSDEAEAGDYYTVYISAQAYSFATLYNPSIFLQED